MKTSEVDEPERKKKEQEESKKETNVEVSTIVQTWPHVSGPQDKGDKETW